MLRKIIVQLKFKCNWASCVLCIDPTSTPPKFPRRLEVSDWEMKCDTGTTILGVQSEGCVRDKK